jgi:thiamine pyrophosphokinase
LTGFDPEIYKTSQYPIEIIHTPDQNKTDLEKAFDYLIERKPCSKCSLGNPKSRSHDYISPTLPDIEIY